MRETSIETYKKIRDDGLLSKLRFEVYKYIYENGPCTAKQITLALRKSITGADSSYHARLSELRDRGVIEEVGYAELPQSKHKVILWNTTNKLPAKIKPVKKTVMREDVLDVLRTEYRRYKNSPMKKTYEGKIALKVILNLATLIKGM